MDGGSIPPISTTVGACHAQESTKGPQTSVRGPFVVLGAGAQRATSWPAAIHADVPPTTFAAV